MGRQNFLARMSLVGDDELRAVSLAASIASEKSMLTEASSGTLIAWADGFVAVTLGAVAASVTSRETI